MNMHVIINDISNEDLPIDVEVIGWKRSLLPESRDELVYVDNIHGSKLKSKPLGNRIIEINFRAYFDNEKERLNTVEHLAKWLYSEGFMKLVLSDEPDVYYLAKVLDDSDLEPQLFTAEFTITFTCQPLKYGEQKTITAEDSSVEFNVDSTYYTAPFIRFITESDENELTVTINGEEISYEDEEKIESNSEVTVDVKEKEFRVNGELKVLEIEGYFTYLENGNNKISINKPVRDLTIDWQELYLYRVDNNES